MTMEPLTLVWTAPPVPGREGEVRGGRPPEALARSFEGELSIPLRRDRPTVLANFVSSLDGIVALGPRAVEGGSAISGGLEADRFLMAMLRALADVVLVGAGTVRAAPRQVWTAGGIHPPSAGAAEAWRASLDLAPQPTTVVVSGRGWYDPAHPGLSARNVPVVVATTRAGQARLAAAQLPAGVRVAALGEDTEVPPSALVGLLADLGARVVLCEGGPHLLGDLLGARLLDELHLTLAPQVLGRDEGDPGKGSTGGPATRRRFGFVEGVAFAAGQAPWAELRSVRRAGDHLFLRYAFPGHRPRGASGGAATDA
ncbi:MAG: dihydrofolate reductase family protein [Candidatus Limnocylindrales bacterium]